MATPWSSIQMAAWETVYLARALTPTPSVEHVVQLDRVGKGALSYVLVSDGDAVVVDPDRGVGDGVSGAGPHTHALRGARRPARPGREGRALLRAGERWRRRGRRSGPPRRALRRAAPGARGHAGRGGRHPHARG